MVHNNGWVNESRHHARGLLLTHIEYAPPGPGRDAVTSYTRDPTWERVTSVTFPEQTVVRFGYDATTGNRIWQEGGRPGANTAYF